MEYVIVEVSNDVVAAAATLNEQFLAGYEFVAWLVQPTAVYPGSGIFKSIAS